MPLTRRHLMASLPLAGATALGVGLSRILSSMHSGQFDPRAIHTTATQIPHFPPLPALPHITQDSLGFDEKTLARQTSPILLNFWASWCIPCVTELPLLNTLSSSLILWGVAYKDHPQRASAFLNRNGQPFQRVGQDITGRAAIEWGVTGVPESFLILPGGRCVWHHRAELTETIIAETLMPLLTASAP